MGERSVGAWTEGGCLCGAIRYRIDGLIAAGCHCHCSLCRRSTGAVVVTWITVRREAFCLLTGTPRIYRSSPKAERSFCGVCGTQLTFQRLDLPGEIDITVASLDAPEHHAPDRHIYASNRVPWLRLDEHLCAYAEEASPKPAE